MISITYIYGMHIVYIKSDAVRRHVHAKTQDDSSSDNVGRYDHRMFPYVDNAAKSIERRSHWRRGRSSPVGHNGGSLLMGTAIGAGAGAIGGLVYDDIKKKK
jgi:hypothetical protein